MERSITIFKIIHQGPEDTIIFHIQNKKACANGEKFFNYIAHDVAMEPHSETVNNFYYVIHVHVYDEMTCIYVCCWLYEGLVVEYCTRHYIAEISLKVTLNHNQHKSTM